MLAALKKFGSRVVADVKAARNPAPAPAADEGDGLPDYAIHTPGTHEAIVLPKPRTYDHPPTPDEHRAEGRRIAFAYARERSGKPNLTWKQAKLLLDRWEKEEIAAERAAARAKAPKNDHVVEAPAVDTSRFKPMEKIVVVKR